MLDTAAFAPGDALAVLRAGHGHASGVTADAGHTIFTGSSPRTIRTTWERPYHQNTAERRGAAFVPMGMSAGPPRVPRTP